MLPERKRAALFVVLIFLCGAVGGAVGVNLWQRMSVSAQPSQSVPSPQSGSPSHTRHAVESFTKRLNLTPEQTQQLTQILDETRSAYRRHELEIESIRRQGNNRIRDILNAEQKARFDQMLTRAEEKRRRNRR